MTIMRKLRITALVAVSAAALVVVPATAAHAASAECTVFFATTTCTTGVIPSNASGHYLTVRAYESSTPANPICGTDSIRWKVVDADNGVVVRRGTGNTNLRISGLYGRYRARIDACPRMVLRIHNI